MRGCDIVIPVYNAYECLEPCIESLVKYTNFCKAHLILIDDKSPDKRVLPLLEKYEKKHNNKITLLRNEKNIGFVATVNRGIKFSNNDVLLLNSDTVVPEGWLDRIIECAYSDKNIATVTPLSNNTTPVRLFESIRKNGFPDGYDLSKMAKLVKDCSMRLYPDLPSGHGFCMYVKREALRKVGLFDEETFGRGYGEENDFCFRCFEYGYRHALCDDVYVLHKGSQSFLDTKKLHNTELEKKHPAVMARVKDWYLKQDLKNIVDNITLAVGVNENRINVLIRVRGNINNRNELIEDLRRDYNLHFLEVVNGNYVVHSFFKDVDLETAIYEKNIVCGENETNSKQYYEMMEEIKNIFAISVIEDSDDTDYKKIKSDCDEHGKKKKIDFRAVQQKVLEYDFVENLNKGSIIDNMKKERRAAEKKRREEQEWRNNLTVPQRVYLKIRYKLIGR